MVAFEDLIRPVIVSAGCPNKKARLFDTHGFKINSILVMPLLQKFFDLVLRSKFIHFTLQLNLLLSDAIAFYTVFQRDYDIILNLRRVNFPLAM